MRGILKKINNYFQVIPTLNFIIIMVVATYLILIPFMPLFTLYERYIGEMGAATSMESGSLVTKIIVGSIVGPIIETLIFQYGIIEILSAKRFLKEKSIIVAIISALLFGSTHSYSFLYVIYAFLIGLVLAYSYITYKKKSFSAFWIVVIIHGIRNTISTILYYI